MPGRYWRNLRCDGCPLACKYADFKVYSKSGFGETVSSMFVDSDDPADWKYKRRHTVLGKMHAHKLELWKHHTEHCPNAGLTLAEIEDEVPF